MKFEKSCGAIIFYQDKEPIFLLLKYQNYWGFVKGNVEKNEDEELTVKREAKEEANLHKINFLFGFREKIGYIYKLKGEFRKKEVVFFLAEVSKEDSEKVKVSWEHEGFKWLNFDEALKMLKHKNEIEVFKKANDFLKKQGRIKHISI